MARRSALDATLETMDEAAQQPSSSPVISPAEVKQRLAQVATQEMQDLDKKLQSLHTQLLAEPQVSVSLAPTYQVYFGRVMAVGLNGIKIYLPVNGKQYKIPKSMAAIVHERRRRADDHIMRTNRMANVESNQESFAGELKFY